MSSTSKPIKRTAQLAPLSREHHEGLLFSWKIRQGISKGIEASRIAAFVQWFWRQHLQGHFQKEEKALPTVLSPEHPMIVQMLHEHAAIKTLVAETTHEDYKKFEALAQAVHDHIRFEERQLFSEVEKAASPQQLEQLAALLKEEESKTAWMDEFWIRSN